jgi:hypothetical protein
MGALSSCRRPSVPVVLAAVAFGLLGGLTGACSSDGAEAAGDDAGAAGAAGETGSDATDRDAATPQDDSGANEDDAAPDAAVVSNPGQVSCGEAECSLPAEACCATLTTTTCQAPGASCEGGVQRCDEAADCESGDVCCLRLDPDKPEATCEAGCIRGSSRLQICKTDAECAEGTCYVNRCAGGVIYRACTAIQGCTQ